jgi:hypothetical protein
LPSTLRAYKLVKMISLYLVYVLIALAALLLIFERKFTKEMLWLGLLSLPAVAIQPLVAPGFAQVLLSQYLAVNLLTCFSLGVVAAAVYGRFLRHHFTSITQDSRRHLAGLFIGPVLAILLYLTTDLALSWILTISFGVVLIAAAVLFADLIWDVWYSCVLMAAHYVLLLLAIYRAAPTAVADYWFGTTTLGVNLLGIPFELLVVALLFGSLWGPIYVAIKEIRH